MKKQFFIGGLLSLLGIYSTVISLPPGTDTITAWEETLSTSDRALSQTILRKLNDDHILAPEALGVKIIVVNGRVTLTGKVSSQEMKKRIQVKAEETTGVISVDNRLDVLK